MKKLLLLLCVFSINTHAQVVYVQDLYLESVKTGNIAQARKYLDAGLNVNILSANYPLENALMLATQNDDMDMIEFLLERGADPSITIKAAIPGSDMGYPSALKYAIYEEHYNLVKFIAEKLIAQSSILTIEQGYQFAEKIEDKKSMEILEQTGYILSEESSNTGELSKQQLAIFDQKYSKLKRRDIYANYPDIKALVVTNKAFVTYLKEHKDIDITYNYIVEVLLAMSTRRTPYRSLEEKEIFDNLSYIIDIYDMDFRNSFINSSDTPKMLSNLIMNQPSKECVERHITIIDFLFDSGVSPLDIDASYVETIKGQYAFDKDYITCMMEYVKKRQEEL